nr:hypothetical protein [Tanacetum cinerariifolium]
GFGDSKLSVFNSNKEDWEGKPIYNRFTKVNHYKGVPPPMNENYMPTSTSPDTDESPRPYGKQTSESTEIKSTSKNSNFSFDFSDRSSVPTASDSYVESARPNNVVNYSKDFTSRTSTSGSEEQVDNVCSPQEALSSSTGLGFDVQSSDSMCNKFGSVHNNLFRNNNASLSQFCYDKISNLDIAKDTGIADSGCSRSISGNKDTLDDFVDFDGGPVGFGGSNGMITGKGTIKTKHLDFENVLYVLEFELSISFLSLNDYLGKFDEKADEGYIVGYSIPGKAYRVYNLVTGKIVETMNIKFLENLPSLEGTGQPWLFDIDYLTDSLNYARIKSTNLSAGNQGPSSNNAGCQDTDSDSDDEQDVIVVQNSPTPVTTPIHDVPNHEETAQYVLSPSLDLNEDDMEELSSLQTQEQKGNDAAQRLGLEFPTHVVTNEASSIPAEKSSSVSPASTPTASAGNTPPVSISADKLILTGRSVSADKPIPAGRSVSADKSISSVMSISASRDTNYADRHPSKLSSNAVFERFPPASKLKTQISMMEKEILIYPVTTKKVNEAHPYSLIIGDLHTPVQTRKKSKAQNLQVLLKLYLTLIGLRQCRRNYSNFKIKEFGFLLNNLKGSMQLGRSRFSRIKGMQGELSAEIKQDFPLPDPSMVILSIPKTQNLYTFSLKELAPQAPITCLLAKASQDESNLWHRRLGHVNFRNMNKRVKGNLVKGLPNKMFLRDQTCIACNKGKQHKPSYKGIPLVSLITTPLHLFHMDLFGPTYVKSITNKYYCLVITDEFTRVKCIRCDNGTEFKNANLIALCATKGIKRDYSNARTPQQNGVSKRKNKTLIEAARTMLVDSLLPTIFWTEAVATACYVLNRFDEKDDEGYIVGYSIPGKAYRVYTLVTSKIVETMNIKFLENLPSVEGTGQPRLFDIDYLTDSLNYARIRSTNLSALNQAQSVLSPSLDLNDDDMEELSSLKTQEQEGKDAAQRLGLAFPTHVVTNEASSIPAEKSSSVSPASTPTASVGNTPPVSSRPLAGRLSKSTGKKLTSSSKTPILAGRSVSADKSIPAGRSVSADKSIPAGRSVSADKSIPTDRSISASRDTNSSDRHPSKLSSNAVSERFPPTSNTQNLDIHDGLKLFDCPSTGIFSSSSYDDEYHRPDISNQEQEILVNPVTTKKVNEAHPHSLIIGDLHTPVQTRKKAKAQVPTQNAFVSYI